MFDVYCPNHGARLLLFADNVEMITNRDDGIDLHWRCTCGATGVRHEPHLTSGGA